MRVGSWGAALVLLAGTFWGRGADAQSLRVDRSAERMRVDGSLREWRGARFSELGSGDDASMRYALAVADGGLYVGAEVRDDRLIRRSKRGPGQDAVVLSLALPDERGRFRQSEVWLHPGVFGREKALAGMVRGRAALGPASSVRVVEGRRAEGEPGYVIEAFIPWAAIAGSELWEQARARLRFEDVDRPGQKRAEQVVASSPEAPPAQWPRIALGAGHQNLLGSFLAAQQLSGVEPRFDLRGDVSGDGRPERVVIVDKYVVVYGPGFKQGESFGYYALPFSHGGSVQDAVLIDATGDGHAELLISVRQKNRLGARDVSLVLSLVEDAMQPLFTIETRKETKGGFVENQLKVKPSRQGPPRFVLKVGRSVGLSASTYQETPAGDASPILLPWGPVRERTMGFVDGAFAVLEERSQKGARPAKVKASATSPGPGRSAGAVREPPVAEALARKLRADLGLSKGARPSRELSANLAGGDARERALVFGEHLVVLGPDVAQGRGYLAYRVPLSAPEDVRHLGAADVTGDGRAELFMRVRQDLTGAPGVHREVLLVLRVDAGRLTRALSAEVTRRQGEQVVANRVVVRGGRLVIEPGQAEGWDARRYPFAAEATGGAEALLLPWSDPPQHYRLVQGRLVAQPKRMETSSAPPRGGRLRSAAKATR